jgi:hypothetical protein
MTISGISEAPLTINDGPGPKGGRLAGLVYLVMIVSAAAGYGTMTRLLAGDVQALPERLSADHALFWLLIKGARGLSRDARRIIS